MAVEATERTWARVQAEAEPRAAASPSLGEARVGDTATDRSSRQSPHPDGRSASTTAWATTAARVPAPASTRSAPHAALPAQQSFAQDCHRLLRRAETSGQRLVTALYLVLARHGAVPATAADGRQHLRCAECCADAREPQAQYPCPTAQEAFWALDAVLR